MATKPLKYVTKETYNPAPEVRYEPHDPETLTVQGETMTIPEMMKRHLNGSDPGLSRNVINFDTEDFNAIGFQNFRNMDVFDQQELLGRMKRQAAEAEKRIRAFIEANEAANEPKAKEASKATLSSERSGAPEQEPNTDD